MSEYSLKLMSKFPAYHEITLDLLDKKNLPIGTEYNISKDRYIFLDRSYSAELMGV